MIYLKTSIAMGPQGLRNVMYVQTCLKEMLNVTSYTWKNEALEFAISSVCNPYIPVYRFGNAIGYIAIRICG